MQRKQRFYPKCDLWVTMYIYIYILTYLIIFLLMQVLDGLVANIGERFFSSTQLLFVLLFFFYFLFFWIMNVVNNRRVLDCFCGYIQYAKVFYCFFVTFSFWFFGSKWKSEFLSSWGFINYICINLSEKKNQIMELHMLLCT